MVHASLILLLIASACHLSYPFTILPATFTRISSIRSNKQLLRVGGFDYMPEEPPPPSATKDSDPARLLTPKLGGTNVYLVGMMGSGKTAVGALLAQRLGPYTFLDTDNIITSCLPEGTTIEEYFASEGEESFRSLESQVLNGVHGHVRCVVSTGGGIVKERVNWSKMQTGLVCFLDVDLGVISARVGGGEGRPLLQDGDVMGKLTELMESRRSMYEQADVTIKVDDGEEDVEETLLKVVEGLGKFIDENPPKHQQEPPEVGE
ncbi:hypothetical protein TrRE_jg1891 [Triparma retinervis]|uniref:shikimate kinase n=1 Tax=Triparma retinervis TaxID=2557542 RepID=A0A9W7DK18_9STRA|nr:hypothetical protein TrRE_jg1891 [Triparma retinervis]